MSASVAVKKRSSRNSKTDKKMDLTNAQQNQKNK